MSFVDWIKRAIENHKRKKLITADLDSHDYPICDICERPINNRVKKFNCNGFKLELHKDCFNRASKGMPPR